MTATSGIHDTSETEIEHIAFVWKSIERIGNCMLISRDGEHLRGRPMRAVPRQTENAIYFITAKSSHKPGEIIQNPDACVCFSEGSHTFISLSGSFSMSDDREKIASLWSSADDAYFPNGSSDPNAILLTYTPESGEYWDAPSNPVVIAIAFIKAQVTGEKPAFRDNAKVRMG
jgi:general stress protein 26